MTSTRWRAEAALAVLLAVVMLIVSGGALWFMTRKPVHEDAAAVPSTAADVGTDRYAGVVDESRWLARALVASDNLPGLSVAVAVDGGIAWTEGFGWADVESRTQVTPLTRFRLGALSKPLTAVAAALLHDRSRLDLDAPVQRYVGAYPAKAWPLTTRQLLGDVGGVHRIRGDNNDAMPGHALRQPRRRGRAARRRPPPVRAGHAASLLHLGMGAGQRGGGRRRRGAVRSLHGPRGVRASGHGAHRRGGDRRPQRRRTRDRALARYSCVAGAGAFLFHANGPRTLQLGHAET